MHACMYECIYGERVTSHTLQGVKCSYKNKYIMENDAQTGEYGYWHGSFNKCIPVFFCSSNILVHIWVGLGVGWFWNTDKSKKSWTWMKTLFLPDVITKWIVMLFVCRGHWIYLQQPQWTGWSLLWLHQWVLGPQSATGRWHTSPSHHWR